MCAVHLESAARAATCFCMIERNRDGTRYIKRPCRRGYKLKCIFRYLFPDDLSAGGRRVIEEHVNYFDVFII